MISRKVTLPAALLSVSAFLSGCFDMAQDPKSEDTHTLVTAAYSGSLINLCNSCGSRPAFFRADDPNKPLGWALDLTRPVAGGYAINRIYYDSSRANPVRVTTRTGGLVDLDVRGNNELWGVNSSGWVFRNTEPGNDNSTWANVPNFAAVKIGAGLNDVFVLSTETVSGGHKLYKWTGAMTSFPWQLVTGGLTDIDVDNNGDLWGINDQGRVFRLPGGDPNGIWESSGVIQQPIAIACGNGKIYVVNSSGQILQLINGSWIVQPDSGYRDIQVDTDGRLWAGTTSNRINTWPGI